MESGVWSLRSGGSSLPSVVQGLRSEDLYLESGF